MVVGILTLEIYIPASLSLKDKRKVVKSVLERVRKRFNVSAAETGYQEKWQRAVLAVALVSEKKSFVESSLQKVFDFLDSEPGFDIITYNFDYC